MDEARKDWKGQERTDVQRHIEAVITAQLERDNSEAELDNFASDSDDLSEGGRIKRKEVRRRTSHLK